MVENDTITDALAQYKVKEDDCFFIPAAEYTPSERVASWQRYSKPAT